MRDFKFIRTKALAPKFEEPTIKELIRCVADNMDDAQWRQYQSLSAEEQEVYAFALLTETEETVTATKKYFYTIAGEIEKLLQNGDEPQLEKLLPEVLKYFPEPQRTYCAMVHSLHDCLARTELIIARINEELGEITNVAQLALFDYYINSGKLKSYCKRHES
nr:MAG TPA: hypothetical protein [Caudoviricetes sp.]DAY63419.1 MAG TPA: hypothetical protein [Caudoviricetes sp.]